MPEPRWLNEEQLEVWRTFITMLGALNEHLDRQLQHDSGMPYTYYEILVVLSQAPNRALRMSELAGLRRASRSRLSHAVARLEEQGYVRRCTAETDKRGSVAILTDEGYAALVAAAPGHVEAVRSAIFDRIGEGQVEELGKISRAILDAIAPGREIVECDQPTDG